MDRRTMVPLMFAVILTSGLTMAQEADGPVRVRVFAHYVSWYHQQVPGGHDHQWNESSLFPVFRGSGAGEGYTSSDPATIRRHNEDFKKYGITPLASWWGIDHYAGDQFLDAYLAVPSDVQIGILYELTGLLKFDSERNVFDMDDPETAATFVAHIKHLKERYFDPYPSRFVKVDGKPVIFLWLSGLMAGDLAAAIVPIRDDVYLIGSELNPFAPGDRFRDRLPVLRGLDAVSSYGMNFPSFHDGTLSPGFVGQVLASGLLSAEWLRENAPGVDVILPLSFSANDTGIPERAPHSRPFMATEQQAGDAADRYRELLAKIYRGCEVPNMPPMINITSYNEIVEGTSVEPTLRNPDIPQPFPVDIGWTYLNAIGNVLRLPIAERPIDCR